MARKRPRKVLYEVTSRVPDEKGALRVLEKTRKKKAFSKKENKDSSSTMSHRPLFSASRGRMFRKFNFMLPLRFSLPKTAIAAIIIAGVVFWIAGRGKSLETSPIAAESKVEVSVESGSGSSEPVFSGTPEDFIEVQPEIVAGPPKDHIIVIATHKDAEQLKPVSKYFAEKGIASEIRESGVFYTLVTSNRFSGPKNASSKLNEAKKQIIKVGADYKAPEGFLSFTFKSVYEKKIMR